MGTPTDTPWASVLSDLRVDDHPTPLDELRRLERYERAYQDLGRALFSQDAEVDDAALDLLRSAQETLGPNPEPSLWRGVLAARAGRAQDADEAFAWCIEQRPQLRDFILRLKDAGLMP